MRVSGQVDGMGWEPLQPGAAALMNIFLDDNSRSIVQTNWCWSTPRCGIAGSGRGHSGQRQFFRRDATPSPQKWDGDMALQVWA